MTKKFKLTSDQITTLVPNLGACFATDRITVDGERVGYMYKQKPDHEGSDLANSPNYLDSGWKFFSGDEAQEYVDELEHTMIYDVNTIANYDPSIIPFLESPVGSAFERNKETGHWEKILDFQMPN